MARLERQQEKLKERAAGLEARLAELSDAQRFGELGPVDAELQQVNAELEATEEQWLLAAETAE